MSNSQLNQVASMPDRQYVVVTRPRHQLAGLVASLDEAVAHAEIKPPIILGLPLLEIESLQSLLLAQNLQQALLQSDLVIFVSPNAILTSEKLLIEHGYQWSVDLSIGVVGGGSQQALKNSQIKARQIYVPENPENWDSEGLWQVLQKQGDWAHKRVTFIKGEGGRHWLIDTLKDAGATVGVFEVYRRTPLSTNDPTWQQVKAHALQSPPSHLVRWLWLLTSSEAVLQIPQALSQLEIPLSFLGAASALCSHARIEEAAISLGFGNVILCQPGDEQLVKASMVFLAS